MKFFIYSFLLLFPLNLYAVSIEDVEKEIIAHSNKIDLNKTDATAYFNRGRAYVKLGNLQIIKQEEKDMFDKMDMVAGILISPEANNVQKLAAASTAEQYVEYKKARDRVLNDKKTPFERAIDDYTTVIKLNPKFADAYYNRHLIYQHFKNDELARADYNSWAKLDPEGAKKLEKEQEDARKAEIAGIIMGAMDALKKDPKNAELYNVLGKAYIEKEDYTKAVVNFTKAIKLQPKNGELYYNRGSAHNKSGNKTFGAVDLAKAKKLGYK